MPWAPGCRSAGVVLPVHGLQDILVSDPARRVSTGQGPEPAPMGRHCPCIHDPTRHRLHLASLATSLTARSPASGSPLETPASISRPQGCGGRPSRVAVEFGAPA